MPTLTKKPLDWFRVAPQVRKSLENPTEAEKADLLAMGESMRDKQQEPVSARPDGTLIFGHRRLMAARLAGLPTLDVTIIEEPLSETQIRLYQLTENVHRADLTAYEKWLACSELMCMNPSWQMKDLAEHLHLKPCTITQLLSPSRCIEAVQDALKEGKIGIAVCYELSKHDAGEQARLLALHLNGAATRDDLARGRKKRNGSAPEVRVSSIRCPLPSGTTVVIKGNDLTLEAAVEEIATLLKAMRKGLDEHLDGRTFARVCADKAKASMS